MSAMLKISLPDGSVREVAVGTTPADIAASIGPGLAKVAIAARVDGELRDIMRPLESDASLALVTARDEADALDLARHDYAHVLAEAVQALFPGTQITFGPSTDDGFYYDFAPKDRAFTEEDLPAIEAEMRRIIAKDEKLIREVWDRDDLIALWKRQGETFKAEWAAELPAGEELTVYRAGDFLDMCRGRIWRRRASSTRRRSSLRAFPALIGAATRRMRCCPASTARVGSTRSSSMRT
jgi:threonyl-tRNA synthetase